VLGVVQQIYACIGTRIGKSDQTLAETRRGILHLTHHCAVTEDVASITRGTRGASRAGIELGLGIALTAGICLSRIASR
jgi:hypothetical protein